jgi:SAM-dependent methyltransferase
MRAAENNVDTCMATNGLVPATKASRQSRMEPIHWIPEDTTSLLDVGCNTGDLLEECRLHYPKIRLAGIDINHSSIEKAKRMLPDAEIQQGYGFQLPFAEGRFQCVTCIEVIEHVPEEYRSLLISEIRRVLVPGGRLVLRCPHDGIFSWLDAQNFRFRFPRLYKALLGGGNRDAYYEEAKEELVWHHHFTREELIGVAGAGWEIEACEFGGLVLFPISDILRWPFYRLRRADNWIVRGLARVAGMELAMDFGKSSYGILMVLRKSTADV